MTVLFHCHPCPEGVYEKKKIEGKPLFSHDEGTVGALAKDLETLGIDKAVAFAPWEVPEGWAIARMPGDYWKVRYGIEANKWLLEELKKHKNILGFVTVNPRDVWAIQLLEEYIGKGFVGVKVHPCIHRFKIDDPLFDEFYGAVEKLEAPIVFHTGIYGRIYHSMPILLEEVAKNHPKLRIILAHAGGTAFCRQALAVAQNNSNCYIDLTATMEEESAWYIPKEEIMLFIKCLGSRKIIYGSDWPWGGTDRIRNDIKFIKNLPLTEKDKNNILGGTIEKVLGLI